MSMLSAAFATLILGEPTRLGALTVFPLLGPDDRVSDYLTLDEALARQALRVTEVSTGGVVPELKVVNDGAVPVLLLDGELLVGAKQNRILNLTILVPAKGELTIPVSCVEAGRWSWRGEQFHAGNSAAPSRVRGAKAAHVSDSLAFRGDRRSDQSQVWEAVDREMAESEVTSPSRDMHRAFEAKEHELERFERELPRAANQRGALFGVGLRVAGLDLFDQASTFAKYCPKLVRSYGLEALALRGGKENLTAEAAARFFDALGGAAVQEYPAIGLGADLRLSAPGLTGAALALDGRIAHLCAFARDEERRRDPQTDTPMAPAWLRRRRVA